jgi:tetratricopeptide (TPR) repeat protein
VNLMQGRDYLLRSRWDNDDTRLGARAVFLSSRRSDNEIDAIENDRRYRRTMIEGDLRLPTEPGQREQAIEYYESQILQTVPRIRRAKDDATYWLGTTYFEEGNYANAIEWLEPIVKDTASSSLWQAGARYLVARSYEAQGKLDKARELYLADDSPQAAGNKLRAAWLTQPKADD